MDLRVTSEVVERVFAHARQAAPQECCGLLFGAEGCIDAIRQADNVHPDPRRRFEIDPRTLIAAHREMRGGGPVLAGYYHSHPGGVARPSETDQALAARDGMIWAIVARTELSFWRAGDAGLAKLPYRIVTL